MKVLIIGKSGQLANELVDTTPENVETLCLGRNELDITDINEIKSIVNTFKPNVIINASAYTAVDKAESDVDAVYAINEQAVRNLVTVAKNNSCKFLHVSTDFIFDGTANTAYPTDAKPNPQSVYGASKLAGEQAIKEVYPEGSSIIRTSWVYSCFGNNFVKTMLKLMDERDELSIVEDQIGCPTYAKGLAQFLWCLVLNPNNELVYHWSDNGVATWYDFAVAIQDIGFEQGLLTRKILLKGIPTSAYPTPAKRPIFSLLNTKSSESVKNTKYWRDQLVSCIKSF